MNFILLAMGMLGIFVHPEIDFLNRIVGSMIISVPLSILACIIPGSIGGGDIKLMMAAGVLLGYESVLKAFAIGIIICGIYVVTLMYIKKADRKTEIALGPFLCIGIIYHIILI